MPRRRSPAVSTRRSSRPCHSSDVSMASRVVPGISLTMARSSPSSWFSSDDLPTLGRPTMAMRGIGASRRSQPIVSRVIAGPRARRPLARRARCPRRCGRPGPRPRPRGACARARRRTRRASALTMASSRSPVPRPCRALMAYQSSQPRRRNSRALQLEALVVGLVDGHDHRRLSAGAASPRPPGRRASHRWRHRPRRR